MTNDDKVKILKQGSAVWNEWRKSQSGKPISLGYANLSKLDLRGADLRQVVLYGSNLEGANLANTNLSYLSLSHTILDYAELGGAILKKTTLHNSSLVETNLFNANLEGAQLFNTKFASTKLIGTNFEKAIFFSTIMVNVDLSQTVGLDETSHVGKSSIGVDTIYASKGKIPHKFLRGVGLPENLIEYMNSLTENVLDYYSCFISYSTKDDDFAKRLYVDLQIQGVRCWFAPEDLKIGQKIRPGIDEAIKIHDKLLLVLSESSMKSSWVEKEVETAFEKERKENKPVLFPVRLDDSIFDSDIAWAKDIRLTRHIGDFTNWQKHSEYIKGFDRLMRDLKSMEKSSLK